MHVVSRSLNLLTTSIANLSSYNSVIPARASFVSFRVARVNMFSTKLLFTLLVVLYYCTSVSTDQYFVVAENTTDCQPADGECHPLSFYVVNFSSYFTNNTIFHFKEGTHTLMDEINLAKVQNVSFIGLNHLVIIYSFVYGNPFYMYNCINISIVNITIFYVCAAEICYDNYGVVIRYSHNVAIFNVTTSMQIYNSFEVAIYNSHIDYFNGQFEPLVHCYNRLQFHNLKFINSTIYYIKSLAIQHGTSYALNVTLDSILLMVMDSNYVHNILLNTNSLYSININNVTCYEEITIQFNDNMGFNYNSCQYPNTSIPNTVPAVIANSYISDVLCIKYSNKLFYSSSVSKKQTLLIDSCTLRALRVKYQYYQIFTPVSVLLVNTQLRNGTNIIINIDSVIFSNVSVSNSVVTTALALTNSKLIINGSLTVSNNMGIDGGGIALYGSSQLEIYPNSNLTFIGNNASNKGGAIYRSNPTPYITDIDCDIISVPNTTNVSIYFINNTAAVGDDIYGITLRNPSCPIDMSIFKTDIKYITPGNNLCFCNSFGSSCLEVIAMPTLYVFPGQKINFSVGIKDVNERFTGGLIIRYLNNVYIDTIRIGPKCTEVSYTATVNSSAVNYTLLIYLDVLSSYSITLAVPFSILPCPIGFTTTHGRCTCSSSITAENVTCDIDTLQISHKGQLWIGPYNASITFNADQPNHHNICLINERCLLCNPSNVSFMLNDTDPQCQQHKSGTLCGSCTTGYSLVLGFNECKECTTNYNMALIILFAFMGIALVVLLTVLNLTVSVGTINGLLFTANIIKLYQPVFLGNQISSSIPFFSQIVSWLNLDFGIKICFYNGMDRYVKEWLQFVFPFYVWAIIIVIILICRVSSKVSRLVGSNAVPVLATLLLLSYTKLLRTIVTALHKRDITLHCQNSTSHQLRVWYEDPTLQYAKGKHLYLFSFSLIVLVLFCVPYTLFLLLNPLFEKYLTKYRLCSFLYKIKPILDAYSGPMKDEYRFWPGLLLVARIPVLLTVTFVENLIQFRYLLLSVLLSVLVVIWSLSYCFQRVYNNRHHNFIETWFIFMLTAMVALAIASDSVIYTTIWYNVSIGAFTCSFIAIVGYHLCLKIYKNFPHVLSGIKEKMNSLKKETKEDRSRLIRTPSYEIDRHDSITDLYEPVNANDYILPERDDSSISMTVVDIHNT